MRTVAILVGLGVTATAIYTAESYNFTPAQRSYWAFQPVAKTAPPKEEMTTVLSREQLLNVQDNVLSVDAPAPVIHYAVRLVRATRVHEGENPDFVYEWVERGAGPRAVHSLVLAAV